MSVSSPPNPRPRSRRRLTVAVAATSAVCATAAAGIWLAGGASAGTVTGTLYREATGTQVADWLSKNPSDSRATVIRDKIASQPASRWFTSPDPATTSTAVSGYVTAANAVGQIPVLTLYAIPNRDCGGASAGGATDQTAYNKFVAAVAANLGTKTALIMLEPDSVALLTCFDGKPTELEARYTMLSQAVTTLKDANPNAKVYLDAGHSKWNAAADQAGRLIKANIAKADGFYSNVSNFNPTASEASFGASVLSSLSSQGVSGKHQVIDTSRNGGASGDWCGDDNTDRRIGNYPTTATNDANIDAYLWVKPPGEADGCAFPAGQFQAALAYSLASSAPNPPSTTAPTTVATTATTTAPTTTPTTAPTTTAPTGNPQVGGCTATYQTTSAWSDGFQGQVTVTGGATAATSWAVSWTLGSGQSVNTVWNGTLSTSGTTVTVRNASYNGTLAANGTASFGFTAKGSAGVTGLTCVSA